MAAPVRVDTDGPVLVVTIDRPEVRNAVDRDAADRLSAAFDAFDRDESLSVAVLTGAGGTFCAGADLKGLSEGRGNRVESDMALDGPMGPTRMDLSKPVIAAIEGFAVAGGLELAVWCDLRVAARDATLGVYCRRWGVPLVDGGTVRLPRLVGHGRAMDLILTGRGVGADEAARDRSGRPGGAAGGGGPGCGRARARAGDAAAALPSVGPALGDRPVVARWRRGDGERDRAGAGDDPLR